MQSFYITAIRFNLNGRLHPTKSMAITEIHTNHPMVHSKADLLLPLLLTVSRNFVQTIPNPPIGFQADWKAPVGCGSPAHRPLSQRVTKGRILRHEIRSRGDDAGYYCPQRCREGWALSHRALGERVHFVTKTTHQGGDANGSV